MIITIDGPAASGKSTVAKRVAKELGFCYIDTGAMYRAVTLEALNRKIDIDDEEALRELCREIQISFGTNGSDLKTYVNGKDATAEIRMPKVDKAVSVVSKIQTVRKAMVSKQRALGAREQKGLVIEGRDTGTVVFPDAPLKIFLTASLDCRAKRRQGDLNKSELNLDLDSIKKDLIRRDKIDSTRKVSPLVRSADAQVIDTTDLDIEEVVQAVLSLVAEKKDI